MADPAEWLERASADYRTLVPTAVSLPDFLRVARRFAQRVALPRPIRVIAVHVPRRQRFKVRKTTLFRSACCCTAHGPVSRAVAKNSVSISN